MPTYRIGGIRGRQGSVEVDIPTLAFNMPSKAEIVQEATEDQDAHLAKRLMGLATKSHGRFTGLARATFSDHKVTSEPAVDLLDRYDGGVWRMNKWLHLAVLSKKVLQHTMDKVLARAFTQRGTPTTALDIKLQRIERTVFKATKRSTAAQRKARAIKRTIKRYG